MAPCLVSIGILFADQGAERGIEGCRDSRRRADGDILPALFHRAEVGTVETGLRSQFLLAPPSFLRSCWTLRPRAPK